MKRISQIALMTMLSVLLLGGTRAFAGDGKKGQDNDNHGNKGGGLVNWVDNLLNDIFGGDNNNQGGNNNNQGDNDQGGNYDGSGWANGGGGGTAPIDGGIGLLLAAGVGLGVRKLARRS